MNRYLMPFIQEDLKERMVFLGGPRQVGKTTLSLQLLGTDDPDHEAYFNWDQVKSRSKILAGELPSKQGLIIFDEIHKYSKWRNLIKGHFVSTKRNINF